MRAYTLASLCVVCAASLFLTGCGSGGGKDTYKVTGKVTFSDGSPLTKGTVVFASAEASPTGEIQSDGTYALRSYEADDGAPAGSYKVFLSGPIFGSDEEEKEPVDSEDAELETYDEETEGEVGEALIHRKFSAPDTSELTCEVKGKMAFDITVEKPE